MTYAIGSDGSVTMPTGYKAQINTWSATLTRATQVVTGFGDAGHQRRASGVLDITGSAGGVPEDNASTTSAFGIGSSAAGAALTRGEVHPHTELPSSPAISQLGWGALAGVSL